MNLAWWSFSGGLSGSLRCTVGLPLFSFLVFLAGCGVVCGWAGLNLGWIPTFVGGSALVMPQGVGGVTGGSVASRRWRGLDGSDDFGLTKVGLAGPWMIPIALYVVYGFDGAVEEMSGRRGLVASMEASGYCVAGWTGRPPDGDGTVEEWLGRRARDVGSDFASGRIRSCWSWIRVWAFWAGPEALGLVLIFDENPDPLVGSLTLVWLDWIFLSSDKDNLPIWGMIRMRMRTLLQWLGK